MTIEEKQAKYNLVIDKLLELKLVVDEINKYAEAHDEECEIIISADILCGDPRLQLKPMCNKSKVDAFKLDKVHDLGDANEFYTSFKGVRVLAVFDKE